jgi:hypothetical protein
LSILTNLSLDLTLKKSKNNIRKKHNCNEGVNEMNNMFFTLFVKTKGNISHDIKFNYDFKPIFSEEEFLVLKT